MFVIIGWIIVFGSILGGYTMHHGRIGVLVQVSEFLIIGGAALGSMVIGNPRAHRARVRQRLWIDEVEPVQREGLRRSDTRRRAA